MPHALSSVNISVKYPGSALMRSMFVLILLTMSSDLKYYVKRGEFEREGLVEFMGGKIYHHKTTQ